MEVAEVAARAAGENFPVGSILFPRRAACRTSARSTATRGSSTSSATRTTATGWRRSTSSSTRSSSTFAGEPTWPVLRNVQPTVREFGLPREPFLRLIEANRMDQRVSEYETWDDLK